MNDQEAVIDESELDVFFVLRNMKKGLLNFGWIILLLAIITSSIVCLEMKRSYNPKYTAVAIFSVKLNLDSDGTIYEDNLRASQLSATFPYILTSGVLRNIIAADLGVENVSDRIAAENVEGTNLFKIIVTSGEAQWAYKVLQSVIKNYPKVAETVVGSTYLDILEESGIPGKPSNPLNYLRIIMLGALPGAVLGLIIIILYAVTRRTIFKKEDIAELSNLKYLGTLPRVNFKRRSNSKDKHISILDEKQSVYRENIYRIRNRVEKITVAKEMKSILITSALPSEGKSTVAQNLALALAEEGRKVVLVDCDLYRPTIHDRLSLDDKANSFEAYLKGEKALEEVVRYIDEMKLSVLACSEPVNDSSEIMGTDIIHNMIVKLEESFDYVILDTAPTAVLSDTSDLAKHVDGAIYIVKQDYAKVNHILDGLEHLSDSSNIEIIGYIFNSAKVSINSYGYGYGYGYGKYGHYGYGRKKQRNEPVMEE